MSKVLHADIDKLIKDKYYGKVIIGFQAGQVVHFEKRITEDPKRFKDELSEERREK